MAVAWTRPQTPGLKTRRLPGERTVLVWDFCVAYTGGGGLLLGAGLQGKVCARACLLYVVEGSGRAVACAAAIGSVKYISCCHISISPLPPTPLQEGGRGPARAPKVSSRDDGVVVERAGLGPCAWSSPGEGVGRHLVTVPPGGCGSRAFCPWGRGGGGGCWARLRKCKCRDPVRRRAVDISAAVAKWRGRTLRCPVPGGKTLKRCADVCPCHVR